MSTNLTNNTIIIMTQEKINQRQIVDTPAIVTVIENGIYYSVNLHWRRGLKRHKCINQDGGPKGQLLVNANELPALQKKYTEQSKLRDRYNERSFF